MLQADTSVTFKSRVVQQAQMIQASSLLVLVMAVAIARISVLLGVITVFAGFLLLWSAFAIKARADRDQERNELHGLRETNEHLKDELAAYRAGVRTGPNL